jgi:hypothetical protein
MLRVQSQIMSFGIFDGQNDTGADHRGVLRFSLPILILSTVTYS